jgi:hypothetical protein
MCIRRMCMYPPPHTPYVYVSSSTVYTPYALCKKIYAVCVYAVCVYAVYRMDREVVPGRDVCEEGYLTRDT